MKTLIVGVCLVLFASPLMAQSDDEIEAYVEMLRSDLRTEKVELIEEFMDFSDEEAEHFWPIYRKYDRELRKINDQRIELIREYGKNYFEMKDDMATELAKRSIDLEIKRAYVRKEYFRKFRHALPAKTAVKFLQLERQIELLVQVQIASDLPFIE